MLNPRRGGNVVLLHLFYIAVAGPGSLSIDSLIGTAQQPMRVESSIRTVLRFATPFENIRRNGVANHTARFCVSSKSDVPPGPPDCILMLNSAEDNAASPGVGKGGSAPATRTPTRARRRPSGDCQSSDLQARAVRWSPHRQCLFHSPSKVVSLQDKSLIWEIAMTGKANFKELSLEVSDKSNSASAADTAPSDTSSPRLAEQTIRRPELRKIVPLADTTIYEMEQRGEFPRRFHLTSRCVVWDLAEAEAWIEERRQLWMRR